MINYIVKTNKGYHAGNHYMDHYNMKKQAVKGWHTYKEYKWERLKWTDDKDKAKRLYSVTLRSLIDKIDDIIRKDLENIEYMNIEIIKE